MWHLKQSFTQIWIKRIAKNFPLKLTLIYEINFNKITTIKFIWELDFHLFPYSISKIREMKSKGGGTGGAARADRLVTMVAGKWRWCDWRLRQLMAGGGGLLTENRDKRIRRETGKKHRRHGQAQEGHRRPNVAQRQRVRVPQEVSHGMVAIGLNMAAHWWPHPTKQRR